MASVRVHFSPGFHLGGGFPAEQYAPAWWYETTGGEAALAGSATKWGSSGGILMLVGGGCSAESCSGGIRNSAEKGISRGANCHVLLWRYSELRREGSFPGSKLSGFCSGGIQNTQSTTCIPLSLRAFSCSQGQVATLLIYLTKNPPNRIPPEQNMLCGKSSSKRKPRAKGHSDGRHFEIIRA
jgi:hypothetical protein